MSVHLTRIWTRTGDDGTTGLADFSRIDKTDPRIGAMADCDEVNSAIGVVSAVGTPPPAMAELLTAVQQQLFELGADLATPGRTAARIDEDAVTWLENACDAWNAELPALTSFVLPGGTPTAALLHAARTATRRAERSVWALAQQMQPGTERDLTALRARYLNRLSDLLFVLARVANDGRDVLWMPKGKPSGDGRPERARNAGPQDPDRPS